MRGLRPLLPLALVSPLMIVAAACWQEEDKSELTTPEPTIGLSSLTLEDVYSRLAEAITRPGFVFHASLNYDLGESGSFWVDVWVDLAKELARYESVPSPAMTESRDVGKYVSVVADDVRYSVEYSRDPHGASKHPAGACLGARSPALSAVLGCEFFPQEAAARVETGVQYRGRAAVALVTEETSETGSYASRLYLDETSFLPLARVTKGTSDGRTWEIAVPYDTQFLPAGSLPQDIFDPASLGYAGEDPEAALDRADLGITVYWLGRKLPGESGRPPLVLMNAFTPGPWPYQGTGEKLHLEYEAAIDHSGQLMVTLSEWSLDEWKAATDRPIGGLPWVGPCVETKEVDLAGGRAVIFMGYETGPQPPTPPAPVLTPPLPADVAPVRTPLPSPSATECPGRPLDRFMAHAYLGSTVVLVNAPIGAGGPALHGPYNSLEGMQAVLRGLKPRE